MNPDLTKKLEEIRKRAEAATPGPWLNRFNRLEVRDRHGDDIAEMTNPHSSQPNCQGFENGDFITHARQDIPFLLDLVESIRAPREAQARAVPVENAGVNTGLYTISIGEEDPVTLIGCWPLVEAQANVEAINALVTQPLPNHEQR